MLPLLVVHCDDPGGATSSQIVCAEYGFSVARLTGRPIALAPWMGRKSKALPDPFSLGFDLQASTRACGCAIVSWAVAKLRLEQASVVHIFDEHLRGGNGNHDRTLARWHGIVWPNDNASVWPPPPYHESHVQLNATYNAAIAIGSTIPAAVTVLHTPPRTKLREPHSASGSCTLIPNERLRSIASAFAASRGLLARGYISVHLRLFDALRSHRMMRKHFVLPVSRATAQVCDLVRTLDRRPPPHVFLSATRSNHRDRSYVRVFSAALLNHSCASAVHLLDDTTMTTNDTWADPHGNSPSTALLDQLVASGGNIFVGTHGSTFTKYIEALRTAARRASPLDATFCCERTVFETAWAPFNWSSLEARDRVRCVAHNLRTGRRKGAQCNVEGSKLSAPVIRRMLEVPLPPETLPAVRGSERCAFRS